MAPVESKLTPHNWLKGQQALGEILGDAYVLSVGERLILYPDLLAYFSVAKALSLEFTVLEILALSTIGKVYGM